MYGLFRKAAASLNLALVLALGSACTAWTANPPALADRLLRASPVTVVDGDSPAKGSKHDYISYAPYYWPQLLNPWKYVYRDGETNGVLVRRGDKDALYAMAEGVSVLTRAWIDTGNDAYADKALAWMHAWFLAPDTRMQPNLEHAQAIPYKRDGGSSGVLEGRAFIPLLEALRLLEARGKLSGDDAAAYKAWFTDYYTWLTTSGLALDASRMPNNHQSWYRAQKLAIALYIGRNADARELSLETTAYIKSQMGADGIQSGEMKRTNTLSYSFFNMQALLVLVALDGNTPDKPTAMRINAGTRFLLPYLVHPEGWPYPQDKPFKNPSVRGLITGAGKVLGAEDLLRDAETLPPYDGEWLWPYDPASLFHTSI